MTDPADGFVAAYRRSVRFNGQAKTIWLIASAPVRLAIFYTGYVLHAVGAFLMGDFHG